ncbi:MAG TPA: glycosyltransferase family 1 protein [Rhodothermales bacterium]|nr:glycosyltransferase family 1 protein [Rhodothermales bacterium]
MPDAPRRPGPLRVALFTGAYNHIADGVSLTLNRLVAYLLDEGVDVRVFAPTIPDPPVQHAGMLIPVPSLPMPGRPEYRVSVGMHRAARRYLAGFAPDLVHVATPDWSGLQARRYALRHRLPLVATYHTHFASYLDYYGLGWLERQGWTILRHFYRRFDRVYVPSVSMADILKGHGFDGNLHLWPRGVDTDLFAPSRRSDAWRTEHGFSPDDVLVTYVGRLVAEKGLSVYAEMVKQLTAEGVPHRSVVVGEGPLRPELEAELPQTVFLGHLEREALAEAYASSDVFVFPSETETFGNVTLEAMASGLPTICADAPGSRSLVLPEKTGLLCPPRDAEAFTEAVRALVQDVSTRRAMGEAAHERAQAYSWPCLLRRMLDEYGKLTGLSADGQPLAASEPLASMGDGSPGMLPNGPARKHTSSDRAARTERPYPAGDRR